MKKPIRFTFLCLTALTALCLLSACRGNTGADAPAPAAPAQTPAAALPTEQTAIPATDAPTLTQEARQAYAAALSALLNAHTLPDGTDLGYDASMSAEGNQFALCDVNADGLDELIVMYTTTFTAGQTAGIYAYDGGQLRCLLTEYPLLTFYDNGMIQAGWSHNHGLSADFWPYTLYRYSESAGGFENCGMVSAWEKAFAAADGDGKPYPDAVDTDGAGSVYFIFPNEEYEEVAPVSAADYHAWREAQLGGAQERTLPFLALTSENIAALQ